MIKDGFWIIDLDCAMLDSKLGGKQEKLFEGNNQSSPLLLPSHHFSASLSMAKILFPWSLRISLPFKHFFVWKLLLGHISRYLGKSDPSTFPVGVHILILAETSAIDLPPSKMTCHFQGHRYCHCCCLFSIFFPWILILIFGETSAIDIYHHPKWSVIFKVIDIVIAVVFLVFSLSES